MPNPENKHSIMMHSKDYPVLIGSAAIQEFTNLKTRLRIFGNKGIALRLFFEGIYFVVKLDEPAISGFIRSLCVKPS